MESLAILVALGLIGGGAIALLVIKLRMHLGGPTGADVFVNKPLSTDVINMASIKVAGVGGFGMVVVSALVALTIPAVGVSVGTGLVTGTLMALFLIRRRQRNGVMPSSTKGPGANTVLAIDASDPALGEHSKGERRKVLLPRSGFQLTAP